MSSSYGKNIRMTIFGQSHSPAIGMTLEGIPAGKKIDMEKLLAFLSRRAPGKNAFSTPRKEADTPEFLCGIKDDVTVGTPITAIIRNTNTRSADYDILKNIPRPGHADYTGYVKYGEDRDYTGGGHFSGRLTAPMCIAGGLILQLLSEKNIRIYSHIRSIGGIDDISEYTEADLKTVKDKEFPVISDTQGEMMKDLIALRKADGDSVGGIVECVIYGLPAGLGDPMFDGMENKLAQIVFGIPAVKGLEFGNGFEAAKLPGSENNDAFCIRDGKVETVTNNCGGILGGITNGMPLVFRAAFKPTPSIAKEQKSIRLDTKEETTLIVPGRHDPCIVPRAVPVVEAAAAIAVYDVIAAKQ
ncbi:MAG: chorismate synthase [Lachnospiraceae bacterium]|nr:chorismate synthase [Lachnospiraceae bacterium]